MSNRYLWRPPTNETLVVDEFTKHLEAERRERRRRMPGAIARGILLAAALGILFAGSLWVAGHATKAIVGYIDEARAR